MNDVDRAADFPREITDAITDAFVVEEEEDEVELDLDEIKIDVNAGLGTIDLPGLGVPTGGTVRVRHLYFNFQRFWATAKTLFDVVLKAPANPLGLVWHLLSTIKNLGENARIAFSELEAPIVYVLASQYRFGQPVAEGELFARVSDFLMQRKQKAPDPGAFAMANTNLSKLGVVTIDSGSIALAERILIRRV